MNPENHEEQAATLSFTGERVIPGKVETDLWNGHISRYHFARNYASGKTVLDVGCGAGYGTELLAGAPATAFGFDISYEAARYAVSNYGALAKYFVASASALPFPTDSIDLITCFEVIEHIPDPEAMIDECARVLAQSHGILFISTPNKPHYAKARGKVGPNPFHLREFELVEFDTALRRRFAFVEIFAQNQQEAVVFTQEHYGPSRINGIVDNSSPLAEASFFLALCAHSPADRTGFTYLAEAGDKLTARERHIEMLQMELADAQTQLNAARVKLDNLHSELASRTEWAQSLDARTRTLEGQASSLESELAQKRAQFDWIENSRLFRIARLWNRFRGRSDH